MRAAYLSKARRILGCPALAEDVAVNALLSFAAHVTPTPDLAALIRAAYDPLLPLAATDPAHALRLAARM